ncbi:MAG TPA: universal stress protein [Burkholderiales bacterium]|nr:universal stress protein [Burkholderiales bacterium]
MHKRILVATDGSRLAARGVRQGVKLAHALGASITGICVIAPSPARYGEHSYYAAGITEADYRKYTEEPAKKALAALAGVARQARVRCATRMIRDAQPWRGILRAARTARCGLIVMSSHGRGAVGGLILGSETARVLAHSKIPVVVVR